MDGLNIICIIVTLSAVIFAAVVFVVSRNNEKRTMKKLNEMLDSAIEGNFEERIFDESVLSALETKMRTYLCNNLASSMRISEERDKIKSLISDISHQTKTPIANILLYSSLLKEQGELPEDLMDIVQQVCSQSEKLNFLIGALIKTSRLETGIISVKASENSVKELIYEALSQVEMKAKEKHINIELQMVEETAAFDRKWTSEAIYNILDNAVKYTENGGHIKIEVKPYEIFCRIDIKDNGIGISEEEHSKIFSRFYRSQNVQSIEGVGIGLFLTREILSAQGGYMKVTSKVGEGSTFSVFLQNC